MMNRKIPTYMWMVLFGSLLLCIGFISALFFTGIYTDFLDGSSFISLFFWVLLVWSIGNSILFPAAVIYQKNMGRIQYIAYLFFSMLFIIYVILDSSFIEFFYPLLNGYIIMFFVLFLSDVSSFFSQKHVTEPQKDEPSGYIHGDYTLFYKDIILKGSEKTQRIYFFSKRLPKDGVPCGIPEGYVIGLNKRTSMPYLKKKRN